MALRFLCVDHLDDLPEAIWEALEPGATVALTSNGKPRAPVIEVGEEDFEETVRDLGRIRFRRAMQRMQEQAARTGADKLTEEEIEAVIQAARRERRAQEGL